jgi:hypothetical protein
MPITWPWRSKDRPRFGQPTSAWQTARAGPVSSGYTGLGSRFLRRRDFHQNQAHKALKLACVPHRQTWGSAASPAKCEPRLA